MKKLLFTLLLMAGMSGHLFAQQLPTCTPDVSYTTPSQAQADTAAIDPDGGIMPFGAKGAQYEEVLKFSFAEELQTQLGNIEINNVSVQNVDGDTMGLSFVSYSANPNDVPSSATQNDLPFDITDQDGDPTFGNYGPVGCAVLYGTIPQNAPDTLAISITVEINNLGGVGTASVTVRIPTDTTLTNRPSVAGLRSNSFEVFPNPLSAQSTAQFELTESANANLKLMDLSGRVVFEASEKVYALGNHSIDLPVADLPSGMYMATLSVNGEILSKKLVK